MTGPSLWRRACARPDRAMVHLALHGLRAGMRLLHWASGTAWLTRRHIDLLKGRRVALVGNAQSLFQQPSGPQIDALDVVIRLNHGRPTESAQQGVRTDVLALSCRMPQAELEASFDPQYSIWVSPRWWHIQPYSWRHMLKLVFYPARRWWALSRQWLAGRRPSTGFAMAMYLLDVAQVAELHLYGFDFGTTPTYYNQPGYVSPHDMAAEGRVLRSLSKQGRLFLHITPQEAA